jgi:hypothetical protein
MRQGRVCSCRQPGVTFGVGLVGYVALIALTLIAFIYFPWWPGAD